MIDIIKELGRPLTFKPVFDNLRQKAALDHHRLLSHPVNHDLTLEWVLRNEVQVVKTLTKQIRKHKYRPQTAQQHQILLDKPRQLFSLAWPDRIVEMALAKIINQAISPSYTESLYSYRKGYGNLAAIESLAGFIAQQHKLNKDIYLAKRDIENFGQSIDTNQLLQKLTSTLSKQSDYLWTLLRLFLQPTFTSPLINEKKQLLSGLPDGYALTPVCENFFLNDIDSQLDPADSSDPAKATNGEQPIEGRQDFYIRYGDDILLASTKRDTVLGNLSILEQGLTRLGLHCKSSKSTNLIFSNIDGQDHRGDDIFKLSKHVDYLGHSVSNNGEIFISQNKLEKLKIEIHRKINYAFLAQRRILGSAPAQVKALINTVNLTFEEELAHPALLLMLATTTNQSEIKHFDRWVAKQILGAVFGTKHDRVFRYISYRQLRIWGLKSLVQERNRRWQRTSNISKTESKRISPEYKLLEP